MQSHFQTIYSEKDYSPVENIQDSLHSSKELMPQGQTMQYLEWKKHTSDSTGLS